MNKILKSSAGDRISISDIPAIEIIMKDISVHRIFMYFLLSIGFSCIPVVWSIENIQDGGRLTFVSCLLFLVACWALLISIIFSYEAVRSFIARYRLYKLNAYTTNGVIVGTSVRNTIHEFSADCELENGNVVSAYVDKTIWENINFNLGNKCTIVWVDGFNPFILKVADKDKQ